MRAARPDTMRSAVTMATPAPRETAPTIATCLRSLVTEPSILASAPARMASVGEVSADRARGRDESTIGSGPVRETCAGPSPSDGGAGHMGGSIMCLPLAETSARHRVPSQSRRSKRPLGSRYQPAAGWLIASLGTKENLRRLGWSRLRFHRDAGVRIEEHGQEPPSWPTSTLPGDQVATPRRNAQRSARAVTVRR